MQWIHHFQLFLFDFDGLLVSTEHLHYQAYVNMLAKRGYKLDWSFQQFCSVAHFSATALREALYVQFPDLDLNWQQVYGEKIQAMEELLLSGKVELMPGAEKLLRALEKAGIQRCVVTHSPLPQIEMIRAGSPVLQSIPHWLTREDYTEPKPSPECYLRAIQLWGKEGDRVVGFEDSIRGLRALEGTPALPVLICEGHHPLVDMASEKSVHFESLNAIPENWLNTQRA